MCRSADGIGRPSLLDYGAKNYGAHLLALFGRSGDYAADFVLTAIIRRASACKFCAVGIVSRPPDGVRASRWPSEAFSRAVDARPRLARIAQCVTAPPHERPHRLRFSRTTKETAIEVAVNLDGSGVYDVSTGIGFLDHMLEQLSRHSLIDITVKAEGDLHIDGHHTTEDTGIALGEAVAKALGDRRGITRYGDALIPMDETLTRVALDISGRPYLVWRTSVQPAEAGHARYRDVQGILRGVRGQAAGITLHIETLYGVNNHHIAESCFKGVARALRAAVAIDPRKADAVPSTKGTLGGV